MLVASLHSFPAVANIARWANTDRRSDPIGRNDGAVTRTVEPAADHDAGQPGVASSSAARQIRFSDSADAHAEGRMSCAAASLRQSLKQKTGQAVSHGSG